MTEQFLLSAFDPPVRAAILEKLDTPNLREILALTTSDRKLLIDRISASDLISSQIQLEIHHEYF